LTRFLVLAALAVPSIGSAQQNPALVAITSPADGAVVTPGQNVSVTVTSPAGVTLAAVGLVGEDPIGIVGEAASLPAQFSVMIPADIAPRRYMLTALAGTGAGQKASATIEIDVARADMPTSIAPLLPQIFFDAPGDDFPMKIIGRFADGRILDVTESSQLAYSTSDPTVATVDAYGMVMAIAPGNASITATYGNPSANISAEVPVMVPPAPFTLTPDPIQFAGQNVATSVSQQVTLTNSSGRILSIVGVITTGDFAQTNDCVSSSPLALDATCTITVTFAPIEAGPRGGMLTIINDNRTAGFTLVGVGQ
jgi:hypothetical protein